MYVYELARELGAEPRELIDCAAAFELGHFSPNTKLTQEQLLQLRESYVKSVSQSRGSLFAGGARTMHPPPSAMPADPVLPPDESPPPPPADPYDSPLLKPIHDPDQEAGGGWGGPLAFDPTSPVTDGIAPPRPAAAEAPSAPAAPRWDEPPSWEAPTSGGGLGGSSLSGSTQADYSGSSANANRDNLSELEYERQFRPDDWSPPRPESTPVTRTVVVGVVGLILIIITTMFVGRNLGIIGPGAERNCIITQSPVEDGEGVIEEIVCVDGYGDEISRAVRRPDEGAKVIEFGSTAEGLPTRVVDLDGFCRGMAAFVEFRDGFVTEVATAESMSQLGAWYDEHDGFGIAGHGDMVGSFGRAGPNPRVVDLRSYLDEVRTAARSGSVVQAQMLFASAEETYGDRILEAQNFSNGNC